MGNLQAGAGQVDITPPLGACLSGSLTPRYADDVSYPLYAKAIVLDDGDTQIAYVQNDLILLTRDQFDVAKARAAELTGIAAENIMMSCTHTHYGPATYGMFKVPEEPGYVDWAVNKIGDSVKIAQNRLQPAVIGHTSGSCPEETHNRRWWMTNGQVQMNPPGGPDLVRPSAGTDPEVALLVVETPDGHPIAAVCNYSLHYVGGASLAISADYFGAFSEALQRMAGSQFVAIMANGCCGDINNQNRANPSTFERPYADYQVDRVGNALAAEAWKVWSQLDGRQADVTVASSVDYPVWRRRTAAEEAQREVAGGVLAVDQVTQKWPDYADEFAKERERMDTLPLDIETQIQALRVGDMAMVGLPGEFFVEYGLDIKRQSPLARTMTIELANDWIGYVPTDRGLDEGSYETWLASTSRVASGSEKLFIDSALKCLAQVAEEG